MSSCPLNSSSELPLDDISAEIGCSSCEGWKTLIDLGLYSMTNDFDRSVGWKHKNICSHWSGKTYGSFVCSNLVLLIM